MSKFISALMLLLIFYSGNAQNFDLSTKTDTFYFRFFFSEEEAEPYQGYFSHGILSIEPFAEGSVYPLYSEYVTDPIQSHGVATVTSIDQGSSGLSIRLRSSPDGQRIFKQLEGIVALPVKVNDYLYNSLLYDMVKNDIYLFDIVNGQPFYTLDDIIENDSPEKEATVLKAMEKEVRFVAEEMVKQGMQPPEVKAGRFNGMDIFEAMKKSSVADIRSFLRYVKLRPRKYQGINWQLAEVYATWIDAGAPSTTEDVEELLMDNLRNFKKFRKYLSSYKKEEYALLAEKIREKAVMKKNEGNAYDEAMNYANVSLKVAEAAEDMKHIGWAYFTIADIQDDQEQREKAIQSYHEAIEYFKLSKEKAGLLAAYNNLGMSYNKRESEAGYTEALKWLNKAVALKKIIVNAEAGHSTLALLYRNLGDTYAGLKKYKKAIEVYELGLSHTATENPMSLKRRSILYIHLADVYEKTNKLEEAEEYTRKGVMTYRRYEEKLARQTKT